MGASLSAQIERALAAEGLAVRVSSAGVSGDTTAGGRARLAWTLGASAQDQPDAAIVELGANDALRGIEPEAAAQNLDAILTELNRCGIPVLLAGMRAPPNLGPEYGRRFDAIFPRLAQAHGVALYPFFLEGVAAVPRLNQDDGSTPMPRASPRSTAASPRPPPRWFAAPGRARRRPDRPCTAAPAMAVGSQA